LFAIEFRAYQFKHMLSSQVKGLFPFFFVAPADYEGTVLVLTFTPTVSMVSVPIAIVNDSIVEEDETFSAVLDSTGQPVETSPALGTVTITEDPSDSKEVVQLLAT
jgi:hypothetical protein